MAKKTLKNRSAFEEVMTKIQRHLILTQKVASCMFLCNRVRDKKHIQNNTMKNFSCLHTQNKFLVKLTFSIVQTVAQLMNELVISDD